MEQEDIDCTPLMTPGMSSEISTHAEPADQTAERPRDGLTGASSVIARQDEPSGDDWLMAGCGREARTNRRAKRGLVYRLCMARTNIDLDDDACQAVIDRYHLTSKRDAVNFALRTVAGEPLGLDEARRLRGSGWDGDLDEMRTTSLR